jgi:hypothetical protein
VVAVDDLRAAELLQVLPPRDLAGGGDHLVATPRRASRPRCCPRRPWRPSPGSRRDPW